MDGLFAAKNPVVELVEQVDHSLEERRAQNLVTEVHQPHSHVGEEVLEARVDDKGIHSFIESSTLLCGLQEGVQVLENTHDGVGDGCIELIDVHVSDSLACVLEEIRGREQKARNKLNIAGKVQKTHGLLNIVGSKGVGGQRVDRRVVLGQLGGIGAGNPQSVVSSEEDRRINLGDRGGG